MLAQIEKQEEEFDYEIKLSTAFHITHFFRAGITDDNMNVKWTYS